MAGSPFDTIPDIATLEERFAFIENKNLRQNVTVCFQYIIFLTVVNEMYSRGGAIELSLYRDIVVHTASIIESCLHYGITELVRRGDVDSSKLAKEWTLREAHEIHTISSSEKIIWGKKVTEAKALKNNPMSQDINKAAKSAGLVDVSLFDKAEAIRNKRNNIHVIGEEKKIVYPSKSDITDIFVDARLILKSIEDKLFVAPF
jgi:hypothetical protein